MASLLRGARLAAAPVRTFATVGADADAAARRGAAAFKRQSLRRPALVIGGIVVAGTAVRFYFVSSAKTALETMETERAAGIAESVRRLAVAAGGSPID
jgi:hypothetical protein